MKISNTCGYAISAMTLIAAAPAGATVSNSSICKAASLPERYTLQRKTHESEKEIAMLLVMIRFLALIQSALLAGQLVAPVRVLAGAHDFNIIGRFEPAMRVPPPAIK